MAVDSGRVHNSCPKSTSHNHWCRTVVRRSGHGTPARLRPRLQPPTSSHSSRSTPSLPLAATGCSPRPPAAPPRPPRPRAAAGPAAPRRHLVVWKLDRLGRSLRHLVDNITSLADRGIEFRSLQEASTPPPPAASSSSTSLPPWPSSNATSSANAPAPDWPPPGPRPPRRLTIGYDHPQAPGSSEMYRSGQYTMATIAKTAPRVSRASVYRHLTGDSR